MLPDNRMSHRLGIATLFAVACATSSFAQSADITLADFEGSTYRDWKVEGSAFGSGPAQGTLPNQMRVFGYRGKGLVNSFRGGDESTGTLTSPPFVIQRKYLRYLIGGGKNLRELSLNLVIDGKVVRSATGTNEVAGGSEELRPGGWDVSEFAGRSARIQIIDRASGTWGHINVDDIALTNTKPSTMLQNVSRLIPVTGQFLNLPVQNGAPKRKVTVSALGEPDITFEIELADEKPDWWAFVDVSRWKGANVEVTIDEIPEVSKVLSIIETSDSIRGATNLYREPLRPQFHFTSRRGWLNDPNGLVYYQGEYHLFYQHNPYGWPWGNMSWGHAVSRDLFHWTELPVALHPDSFGTMFSGSAVVDWHNTAGFERGPEKTLVALYTAAGKPFTQCLAYSRDRGRTWVKFDGNPVMDHVAAENRDPKVVWFEPEKKWIMSLYLDRDDFAIYDSKDLRTWRHLDDVTIPGTNECPNFFPMPLDGDPKNQKWVFVGANGGYLVGSFDGHKFRAEGGVRHLKVGDWWYAAQVYSDAPDHRTILIPWLRNDIPGMPFNQMMGLPVDLTLRSTDSGPRIFAVPSPEVEKLRGTAQTLVGSGSLKPSTEYEMETEFAVVGSEPVTFEIQGLTAVYDVTTHELRCRDQKMVVEPVSGKVKLRMFVDRTSLEIFGEGGSTYFPIGVVFPAPGTDLRVTAPNGAAVKTTVYPLTSVWR